MNKKISPAIQAMLAKSNVTTTDDMESGSSGVPRISLKKSKFTAKAGDDELKLGETIDVVILGINPERGFARTWYEGGYTAGSTDAPSCSSTDGLYPDNFVTDPPSDKCRTCDKAQWGSAKSMSGGKAMACKMSKQLYVKIAEELDDVEKPTYLLIVTVLSLKAFGAYGKLLAKEGIPTASIVVTRLGFDEGADVPKLTFELIGVMDEDNVKASLAIAEEKDWEYKPAEMSNKQKLDSPTKSEKPAIEGESEPVKDGDIDNATENW